MNLTKSRAKGRTKTTAVQATKAKDKPSMQEPWQVIVDAEVAVSTVDLGAATPVGRNCGTRVVVGWQSMWTRSRQKAKKAESTTTGEL